MLTKIMDVTIGEHGYVSHLTNIKNANDAVQAIRDDEKASKALAELLETDNPLNGGQAAPAKFSNIYIQDRSVPDLCQEKYGASFKGLGQDDKDALMGIMLYDSMRSRDSVICCVHPRQENPEESEVSIVRPMIKQGFFARLLDGIKGLFGMSGTQRAYDGLVKELGDKCGQKIEADVKREKKVRDQAEERGAIQRDVIKASIKRDKDMYLDDEAFFGEDTTKDVFNERFLNNEILGTEELFKIPKPKEEKKTESEEKKTESGEKKTESGEKKSESAGKTAKPEEKSYKQVLNESLQFASLNAGLKTIGSRIGTRVDLARFYMLAEKYPMDIILSTDEDALKIKKQVGKELVELLLDGDKETVQAKMTEVASKAVEYFANPENYPRFDITSDKEIAENLKDPKYYASVLMSKDLEQIFLYDEGKKGESPYIAKARGGVSDEVYDRCMEHTQNFMKLYAFAIEKREIFILTPTYSEAYKTLPQEEQAMINTRSDRSFNLARGLCALDTAHALKEKYGNDLAEVGGTYAAHMSNDFSERVSSTYRKTTDLTWKNRIENQVILGEKPAVNEEGRKKAIDGLKEKDPEDFAIMEKQEAARLERKAAKQRVEVKGFANDQLPEKRDFAPGGLDPKTPKPPVHGKKA